MADMDNLLEAFAAGATGALEGFNRAYIPLKRIGFEDELARRRKQEERQYEEGADIRKGKRELEYFRAKLPLEEESKIRIEKAKPPIAFVDPSTGLPVTYAPRGSKALPKPTISGGETQSRQDEAARRAVSVVKNYYTQLKRIQGEEPISGSESFGLGVRGLASRIPAIGRATMPETSQLTGFRQSQGARLAKAFGDSGNIALQEQKNALELLSPPGTRDLDIAERQALATALEGIKNRTPEEEKMHQEAVGSFELKKKEIPEPAIERKRATSFGQTKSGLKYKVIP